MITADVFERQYAERSGVAVETLRERRKVVPCGPELTGCDDPRCEGWGSVNLDADECGECGVADYRHGTADHPFTRERRWPR